MRTDNRQQTTDDRGRGAAGDSSLDAVPTSGGGRPRARHSFRGLASWQKAQELTDAILDVVANVPRTTANDIIIRQLVASASSIAANIAEGHGRFAAGAYRNYLSIARGSANETIGWIDLLWRRRLITAQKRDELFDLCEEILRIVSAQMIQLDQSTGKAKAFREEPAHYDAE